MSITSLSFVLFLVCVAVLYYSVPPRFQWCILLCASGLFYVSFGWKSVFYVLFTATTIFFATVQMQRLTDKQKAYLKLHKLDLSKEERRQYKETIKRKRKALMVVTLLANLSVLCAFKYIHFAIEQVNGLIGLAGGATIYNGFKWLVPLGISFYTFQSIGYLVDVYWENYRAEKNYLKVLLFVSFFPQMTQGPISDYEQLSGELFSTHRFLYQNYAWGIQRMLWGFFKKMLIADTLSPWVTDVFKNYNQYAGITVLIGAFMYSIQIYADFSGYMDIMCGYCELLGIKLTENFERPYFSKSVAEYWRRWHISLGNWFKKYVYYAIGMSKWSRAIASQVKQKYGKGLGDTIPATIALVVVWLATGLWHGASWAYISWGLVNGLFIIMTLWLDPLYAKCRTLCRVREQSKSWKAFQVLRTFVIVTFIKVLPEVGTLSSGLGLWKRIFTNFDFPKTLSLLLPFVDWSVTTNYLLLAIAGTGTMMMVAVSLLQRKQPVRAHFNRLPMAVRITVLVLLAVLISSFGVQATWGAGGFLYANF